MLSGDEAERDNDGVSGQHRQYVLDEAARETAEIQHCEGQRFSKREQFM